MFIISSECETGGSVKFWVVQAFVASFLTDDVVVVVVVDGVKESLFLYLHLVSVRLWVLKLEFGRHFVWIMRSAKYLVIVFMHCLDVMCNVFEVDGPILFIISFESEAGD